MLSEIYNAMAEQPRPAELLHLNNAPEFKSEALA
jgi:hypothetical protein